VTRPRRSSPPPRAARRRPGFTLIELILACVMMSILFSATYASLSQAVRSRDRGVSRAQAFTRASLAADLIARDLASTLRASDLAETKLAIVRQGRPGSGLDGLLLFTHLDRPVRPASGQPEGAECETQYRLEPLPQSADAAPLYALWRRRAPVPDEYPDAGGVAVQLVDGLRSLTIEAFSGSEWLPEWDSDLDGLPYAVRLTVVAADDDATTSASARRVVALDRVPIPPVEEDLPDSDTGSGQTPAGSGSTQGGTGSGSSGSTTPATGQGGATRNQGGASR
jgi:prepilin-type N-terminal cleavage/methylation domain-containing protein